MKPEIELVPCLHCSHAARTPVGSSEQGTVIWTVWCSHCAASVRGTSKRDAMLAWNRQDTVNNLRIELADLKAKLHDADTDNQQLKAENERLGKIITGIGQELSDPNTLASNSYAVTVKDVIGQRNLLRHDLISAESDRDRYKTALEGFKERAALIVVIEADDEHLTKASYLVTDLTNLDFPPIPPKDGE